MLDGLPGAVQAAEVTQLEEVILQLTRLGSKGDTASVIRYAKRLLKRSDSPLSEVTRSTLASLIADQASAPMRFVTPTGFDSHNFVSIEPEVDGDAPVLSEEVDAEIQDIVREHKRSLDLERAGLVPTRTLLLTGAPGVGKTMTARDIAKRLDVPLFRVDLSALMSSYLGQTGHNLKDALNQAKETESVMLLDEFDAIAKRRDDPTDVGELKRIVNVLLLELDAWPPSRLLIAATNHPELLDRAIWRRFEKIIAIGMPDDTVRARLLQDQLKKLRHPVSPGTLAAVVSATHDFSCSDIVVLARASVRRAVLTDASIDAVLRSVARDRLLARAHDDPTWRDTYCHVASQQLGLSQREIASQLGVSHVTVGKALKKRRAPGKESRRKAKPENRHA